MFFEPKMVFIWHCENPLSIILIPPMKKSSGLNQERNMHRSSSIYKQSKIVLNVDFDVRWTFSLEEALLWIMD